MDDIGTAFSANSWLHHTHSIAAAVALPHGNLRFPNKAVTHTPTTGDHSPPPLRPTKRTRLRVQATPHVGVAAPTRILPDPHPKGAPPQLDQPKVPPPTTRTTLRSFRPFSAVPVQTRAQILQRASIELKRVTSRNRKNKANQQSTLLDQWPSEPPAPTDRPPDYALTTQQPP